MKITKLLTGSASTLLVTNAFTSILGAMSLRWGSISIPPAFFLFTLLGIGVYYCWKMLRVCIIAGIIALVLCLCMDNRFFEQIVPDIRAETAATEAYAEESLKDMADRLLPEQDDYEAAIDTAYTERSNDQGARYIRVEFYFSPYDYNEQAKTFAKVLTVAGKPFAYESYLIQACETGSSKKNTALFYALNDENHSVTVILLEDARLESKTLKKCLSDWHFS